MKYRLWLIPALLGVVLSCNTSSSEKQSGKAALSGALHSQRAVAFQATDSTFLHQADSAYERAEKITDLKKSDSALYLHKKALEIREKFLTSDIRLLNSYYKVGMLYWRDNKFGFADAHLEKARKIAEANDVPKLLIFDIYWHLALCKKEAKDYPTATSIALHLLRLIQERDPTNNTMLARTYATLASIYRYSNQKNKAIENWLIAIRVAPPDNRQLLGEFYHSLSIIYYSIKNYGLSNVYIDKSIRETLISREPDLKIIADRYLWKAFLLLGLNKTDSARIFFKKTLQIRTSIFGQKNSYTFGVKYGIGDFYDRVNLPDSSLYFYHQSLISLIRGFDNPDVFTNPQPKQDEINVDLILGLSKKAAVAAKLYQKDSSKINLLDLALKNYLLADSVFTEYRKNILHDDPLLSQMQGSEIPYSEVIRIALKLFDKKKLSSYFDNAFHMMESSRAIVLQNALNRATAFSSAGISDSLLDKENKFIQLRAELIQKMSEPTLTKEVRDSLDEELLLAYNRELALQEELKKANPNYFSIKYEKILTVDEVKKLMTPGNFLIEFKWSDSAIYSLLIGKNTVRSSSIPVTKNFQKTFGGFVDEFSNNRELSFSKERFKEFCDNSHELFNRLLKDLIRDIDPQTHIIISADGPLATFPFEALITHLPESEEVNYHLPYLVFEHPVSYANSAGVLSKQLVHKREGKKLLAFGYAGKGSSIATRSGLSDLPGTEKEILAIKDIMKNHVNQYKLKEEASEFFFKQHVADFDIVHLAVHGEGDTLDALNSKLIFRSKDDHEEDGSLYAHELYNLKLKNLDLAVLSACESGVGKLQNGEGVMSIARGFAYAGCPSQLISLWKIDDQTSAKIMKAYYDQLSRGASLDKSLAKAKTDYITTANEFKSHPYYWAAFLQVGQVQALDVRSYVLEWVLFSSISVILIFFIIRRLRKRTIVRL